MSQIFVKNQNGSKVIPVTLIESDTCVVTQIKTKEKDGYESVQVGFGKRKKINKPIIGHLKNIRKVRHLREFRIKNEVKKYNIGDEIKVSVFKAGDKVKVTGTSKAKGFQGVMKRHSFKGGPASHGQKHSKRKPGSIGSCYPEHVVKGKKMAGRMGGISATQLGLEVVEVDSGKNVLLIKGSIPGKTGSLVKIISQLC